MAIHPFPKGKGLIAKKMIKNQNIKNSGLNIKRVPITTRTTPPTK